MSHPDFSIDRDQALARLMRFLTVEGVTGQEKAIGREVMNALREAGVSRKNMRFDSVHEKIPVPTQTGNLIVSLPGTQKAPRRMFMTHLDTVPLCAGAVPVHKGNRIVSQGQTALGGDNRTGVASLVNMVATLLERKIPHPPITVLFTVREESGLWGARFVDPNDLGNPEMCFNVDGGSARRLTIGAVGADRWEVEILGRASHAGVHPEQGISATAVASLAIADAVRNGWFGRVNKNGNKGTSNVGVFGGKNNQCAGDATNVVTDYVLIRGESRSHQTKFVGEITAAFRDAFKKASQEIANDKGRKAKVRFKAQRDYYPFALKENSPAVQLAKEASQRAGWTPEMRITDGGLDANWLVKHGIPTVTIGAGQNNAHTVDEYVEIKDFLEGCRLALALATQT